jgi:ubiquinol-cytochrome c reductase iron-sulfur subunit
MASTKVLDDPSRRRWVTVASLTGGAGIVVTSVPFVASLAPSERARALGAPVEVDIRPITPGDIVTVEWRGKPVWVHKRTPQMLDALREHDDLLSDPRSNRLEQQPDYARNEFRSIKPEIGVLVAVCTHLGCVPTYRPEPGGGGLGPSWPGGFFCPCHGSKFDFAGRVYKNVPAPSNLEVPPHRYIDAAVVLIGDDGP